LIVCQKGRERQPAEGIWQRSKRVKRDYWRAAAHIKLEKRRKKDLSAGNCGRGKGAKGETEV